VNTGIRTPDTISPGAANGRMPAHVAPPDEAAAMTVDATAPVA